MDLPKLCLGPSLRPCTNTLCSEFEVCNNGRKRKIVGGWEEMGGQEIGIDLQLNSPLPLDWEQCLDLQSGRMYQINRKASKKSWVKPKEKNKLDLDLNISNLPESESVEPGSHTVEDMQKPMGVGSGPDSGMVAIVCLNCYLLVMLYRSSPSCPNCKYVHTLHSQPAPQKTRPVKTLETLSLLH